MSELLALIGRHLREMTRGRLARTAIILFLLGVVLAAWLGARSEQAGSLMLLAALLVLTLLAAGAALGAGGALPEDRIAGREQWLATLAPPAWKRRVAAALAGWLLALGLGTCGGAVAGLALSALRPDLELRASTPLGTFDGVALSDRPDGWALEVRRTGMVDIDVRPRYRRVEALVDRVELEVVSNGRPESLTASVRGPIRFVVERVPQTVRLRVLTPGVTLHVREARLLHEIVSPLRALTLAGLLLGLLVGGVAPLAVFISRATTGQTAAAAACCLLLFGTVKGALLALAGDLDVGGPGALASYVLRAVGMLAPDTRLLSIYAETGALRAPQLAHLGAAVPALIHGLVAFALVALPVPRRLVEGANA